VAKILSVIGINIGKNSFHVVGLDRRSAIVLRQKWSRGQVESRFANMLPCLIGKRRSISKPEAYLKQLVNRAATGDLAVMRHSLHPVPKTPRYVF